MKPRSLAAVAIVTAVALVAASRGNPAKAGSHFRQGDATHDVRQAANDQTPSVPEPTFPAAVRQLSDPAKALEVLDRDDRSRGDQAPVEALVLRARLLSDLHRYRESVPLWDEIVRRDGNLASFATRSAIADLLDARSVDEAAARARAVTDGRVALTLALADGYKAIGQSQRAGELYADVLAAERQTALADRARLGLAAAQEAAGDLDAALATLHRATISWRLADTFATARSDERRVAGLLRREAPPLTADEYSAVADRLAAVSNFDAAVALLEEGLRERRLPPGDASEAAIVEYLYRGRQNDAAMARATAFLTRFPGSKLAASVRLVQLRLDIRVGKLAQARARLSSMLADPRVPLADRQSAQRLVAANLAATGGPRDALTIYRALLRTRLARPDRYDVCWRAALAAIRAGDHRAAIDLLRQARKLAPARSLPRSTLYWLAAATERTGDRAQARDLWTQVASENAYDYYGLRSLERLRAAGVPAPPPTRSAFPFTQVSDGAMASPEVRAGLVLARAGLYEDAASALRAALARFRTDGGLALLTARAATAAGDYATAWSVVSTRFGEFLARPADGLPEDVWQMAFPRAYWTEVAGAATRNGVDPLLLLALMRRESRFVVTARSRTGAVGLFQMMPYTVREIMPAGEGTGEKETPLNAPASADLAARLVKRIVTRFNGAPAPVVAAYNAGEDRVGDWWRASAGLPEDLFVDSIPYGETRQYVREVLANYATYKRLYGASDSPAPPAVRRP